MPTKAEFEQLVKRSGLSTRAMNCLYGQFGCIDEFIKAPASELFSIPNLGMRTFREIDAWRSEYLSAPMAGETVSLTLNPDERLVIHCGEPRVWVEKSRKSGGVGARVVAEDIANVELVVKFKAPQ